MRLVGLGSYVSPGEFFSMTRTHSRQRSTFIALMLMLVALLGGMFLSGCSSASSSGWAQTSPVLHAESGTASTVSLGLRDG